MHKRSNWCFGRRWLSICFLSLVSLVGFADPSTQVARLSEASGTVSFLPAGEQSWVPATLNRPLITGDQLWSDTASQAEMQLAGGMIRLSAQTNVKLLNLTADIAQFQLTDGALVLDIKRDVFKQGYEVDTPNLAFSISTPGYYRIDVNAKNNTTTLSVRQGQGVVYGTSATQSIQEGQLCSTTGTNLSAYQCQAMAEPDAFDRSAMARHQQSTQVTTSSRYVSPNVIGQESLDNYGTWQSVGDYGPVWLPNNVGFDWAPYRDGHWIWLGAWGWTWVDNNPWGFAPFHYGRWASIDNQWFWVPGPVDIEPVYAPALVAFIGDIALAASGFGVGWFPLAPGELYMPPYEVSQRYFMAINLGNTRVNTAYALNGYKHRNLPIHYQNARIANGVTVVPKKAFVQSAPVNKALVHVPAALIEKAPKTQMVHMTPEPVSVLGGHEVARVKPAAAIVARPTIVKIRPPATSPSFVATQRVLLQHPGKPLTVEEAARLSPDRTHINTQFTPARAGLPVITHEPVPVNGQPVTHGPAIVPGSPTGHEPAVIDRPPVIHEHPVISPPPVIHEHPAVRPPPVIHEHPAVRPPPVIHEHPVVRRPPPVIHEHPAVRRPPPVIHEHPAVRRPPPVIHEHPAARRMPREMGRPEGHRE